MTRLLPTYHPAAALHQTSLLRHVYADFEAVGRALRGWDTDTPTDHWAGYEDYANDTGRTFTATPTALDTETTACGNLWSVQLSSREGTGSFFSADQWCPEMLDTPLVIAHNAVFDFNLLNWWPTHFVDTMYAAYLLGLPQGLKELAWRLCGMEMHSYTDMISPTQEAMSRSYLEQVADHTWPPPGPRRPDIGSRSRKMLQKRGLLKWWSTDVETDPTLIDPVLSKLGPMPRADLSHLPFDEALTYACRDADATLRVWNVMQPLLNEANLLGVLEMGCHILPMVHTMMHNGMPADGLYFEALSEQYGVEMEEARLECLSILGSLATTDFNPNSDQQVAELLFTRLHLSSGRKTPTGRLAVDETQLNKLDHPSIPHILRYRHLLKLKTTYAEPLAKLATLDGRIRGQIKTTRTETGRLSMAEPNLQNIPTRTEEGRRIRRGFRVPPNHLLLAADYSQIEMRVLAHETGAPTLLQIFREGRDVHTETAAAMFGVPLEEATSLRYRAPAKTLGFGVAYGLTKHGMLDQMQNEGLDWSLEDCQRFLTDYYTLHKGVRQWQDNIISNGIERGYVTDMFGRRRFTPELSCPISRVYEAGVRQAINLPIQAGAAGILTMAMAQLWRLLHTFSQALHPLLQVHDELIFEVHNPQILTSTEERLSTIMTSVVRLDVPTLVNIKSGPSWGELT